MTQVCIGTAMGGGEGAVGGYARPRLLLFLVQRPPWGTPYHYGEDFGSPDRALEETCYGGMESRGVCEASRYTASLRDAPKKKKRENVGIFPPLPPVWE